MSCSVVHTRKGWLVQAIVAEQVFLYFPFASQTRVSYPRLWATVIHAGLLTVSYDGAVTGIDWKAWGSKEWLWLASSPLTGFCELYSHVASVKWANREDGDSVNLNPMKPAQIIFDRFLTFSGESPNQYYYICHRYEMQHARYTVENIMYR